MRKKKKTTKKPRPSAFVGLVYDALWVITLLCKVGAWPIGLVSKLLHRLLRNHPLMRFKHSHAIWCVVIGLFLVLLSVLFEDWSHHLAWKATIETTRAAGVCPLWELIATLMNLEKEFV